MHLYVACCSLLFFMFLALHICAVSERCLLTCCLTVAVAEKQRHFVQQGNNKDTKKNIQLIISFNRSSKHIRFISKLHFNSWFLICCTIWSWNPMEPNLCSVQLIVLQMKRTVTNWTWSNTAYQAVWTWWDLLPRVFFLKPPFEHTSRPGPRPPTNRRLWNRGVNFLCKFCPAGFPSQRLGAMNDHFKFCSTWSRSFRKCRAVQCEVGGNIFCCWGHLFMSRFWWCEPEGEDIVHLYT